MTDDNNTGPRTGLDRTFAPMLSELEDAEVRLTKAHAAKIAEARVLEAELDRIAKVKRVMLGEPKPRRQRAAGAGDRTPSQRTADSTAGKARADENRARVRAHLIELGEGKHFRATDLARVLELPPQGLGPILNGFERHGLVEMIGMTDDRMPRKRYRVTPQGALPDPEAEA